MTRVLRLLLVAALVAAPAAAMPAAAEDSSRAWTIGEAANPAATALEAVMTSPSTAVLGTAGARSNVARLPVGVATATATARPMHGRNEPYRPRVVRRHRPSPRNADGEPPH